MRTLTKDGLPKQTELPSKEAPTVEELLARIRDLEEQLAADRARIARLRSREFEASLEKQVAAGLKAATFKCDPHGRIISANAHAARMCGPLGEPGGNIFSSVIDRLQRPSGIVTEDSAVRAIPKSYGDHVREQIVAAQQVTRMGRARRDSSDFEIEHSITEQLVYEAPDGPVRVLLGMSYVRDPNGHPWIQLTLVDLDAVNRDDLTGLWRRGTFDNVLDRKVKERMRMQERMGVHAPLALAMVDIDRFKPINDTYGHQAGDDVLKAVARRIQRAVPRGSDMVARYGGEEFAVVMDADADEAALVARRILHGVRSSDIAVTTEHGMTAVRPTVSIGLALFQGEDDSPSRMIARADAALYEAKGKKDTFLGFRRNRGRNRAVFDGMVLPDADR